MLKELKQHLIHNYTRLFAVMAIGAAVGLLASFVLSVEAITLAKDSHAVLSCDVNAALSCGAVGRHWSASVFGFPNAFIGMVSFSVMLTIAMAGLMGAKLPKLFMYCAQAGAAAGLIFAMWMFLVSYMVIGTLCPWCLTTDASLLLVVWALTRYNVLENNLYLPKKWQHRARAVALKGYDTLAVAAIAATGILAIIVKFGNTLF